MPDGQDRSRNSDRDRHRQHDQPFNPVGDSPAKRNVYRMNKPGSQFARDPTLDQRIHGHRSDLTSFSAFTAAATSPDSNQLKRKRSSPPLGRNVLDTPSSFLQYRQNGAPSPNPRKSSALNARQPSSPLISKALDESVCINIEDDSPTLVPTPVRVFPSSPTSSRFPILDPSPKISPRPQAPLLIGMTRFLPELASMPKSPQSTSRTDELDGPADMPRKRVYPTSPPKLKTSTLPHVNTVFESRIDKNPKQLLSGIIIPHISKPMYISHFRFHGPGSTDFTVSEHAAQSVALVKCKGNNDLFTLKTRSLDEQKNVVWTDVEMPRLSRRVASIDLQKMTLATVGDRGDPDVCSCKIRLQGSWAGESGVFTWDLEFEEISDLEKIMKCLTKFKTKTKHLRPDQLNKMFAKDRSPVSSVSRNPIPDLGVVSHSIADDEAISSSGNFQLDSPSPRPKIVQRLQDSYEHVQSSSPTRRSASMKLPSKREDARPAISLESGSPASRRSTRTSRASLGVYPPSIYGPIQDVQDLKGKLSDLRKWRQSLVYPPEGPRKVTVSFDDLARLQDREFLNDNIIEFYLRYLQEKHLSTESSQPSCYFFNTHFYTVLTHLKRTIDYPAVERWTSKEDIFAKDLVVIPINESSHWYLAVVFNLKSIPAFFDKKKEEDGCEEKKNADSVEATPKEEDEKDGFSTPSTGTVPDEMNATIPDSTAQSFDSVLPVSAQSAAARAVEQETPAGFSPKGEQRHSESLPPVSRSPSLDLLSVPVSNTTAPNKEDSDVEMLDDSSSIKKSPEGITNFSTPEHNFSQASRASNDSLPPLGDFLASQPSEDKDVVTPYRSKRLENAASTQSEMLGARQPRHSRQRAGLTTYARRTLQSKAITGRRNGITGTETGPSSSPAEKPTGPTPPPYVVILDSLGLNKKNSRTISNIKDYLIAEAKAKRGWDLDRSMFRGVNGRDLPTQQTSYDCGVYLLYYMDAILRDWKFALECLVKHLAPSSSTSTTGSSSLRGRSVSGNPKADMQLTLSSFGAQRYRSGRRLGGDKLEMDSRRGGASASNPMEVLDDSQDIAPPIEDRRDSVEEVATLDVRSGSKHKENYNKSRIDDSVTLTEDVVDLLSDDDRRRLANQGQGWYEGTLRPGECEQVEDTDVEGNGNDSDNTCTDGEGHRRRSKFDGESTLVDSFIIPASHIRNSATAAVDQKQQAYCLDPAKQHQRHHNLFQPSFSPIHSKESGLLSLVSSYQSTKPKVGLPDQDDLVMDSDDEVIPSRPKSGNAWIKESIMSMAASAAAPVRVPDSDGKEEVAVVGAQTPHAGPTSALKTHRQRSNSVTTITLAPVGPVGPKGASAGSVAKSPRRVPPSAGSSFQSSQEQAVQSISNPSVLSQPPQIQPSSGSGPESAPVSATGAPASASSSPSKNALRRLPWPWAQLNPVRYRLQIVHTLADLSDEQDREREKRLQSKIDAAAAAKANAKAAKAAVAGGDAGKGGGAVTKAGDESFEGPATASASDGENRPRVELGLRMNLEF